MASQGANFSGKSVYLKQIALITFMAHIGARCPFSTCAPKTVDTCAPQCRLLCPHGRRPHRLDGPHHDEGVDEGVDHEGEFEKPEGRCYPQELTSSDIQGSSAFMIDLQQISCALFRPFALVLSACPTPSPSLDSLQNVLTPTASRSFALRNLTPRSLLIIDEFGKGTEPDDGAGLFCGVVDHLVGLGSGTVRSGNEASLRS